MNRLWTRMLTVGILAPGLFLAACASDVAEVEPDSGDIVEMTSDEQSEETSADEAEMDAEDQDHAAGDDDAHADEAAESGESEHRGPGEGMGMQHQRMQEQMHEQMLASALEQGLLTQDDVDFFNEIHPTIEAYHPEGASGEGVSAEAKKSMQRGFAAMAVDAGELSQEDADRFTEIHDILADAGLMNHDETSSADDMHEDMHAEHMAEMASGEELDLASIMVGLGEATNAINAGLWAEDFDAIAAAASSISNHPVVSADERNAIQQILGEDFSAFGAGDHKVHEGGLALAEAAESRDMDAVLAAYSQMQQDCVACHTSFRDRIADR